MSTYDNVMDYQNTVAGYQKHGKILIRSEDREWEITKQGRLKYYLEPNTHKDHALRDWMMFVNDVQTHSGSHKHQGGVVIFVLEGTLVMDSGGMHEVLEKGDCAYVDSDMAIAWSAGGTERCRALVVTPGNRREN